MKPPDMGSVGTVGKPRAWYVRNISKMLQFEEEVSINIVNNQSGAGSLLNDNYPIFPARPRMFSTIFSGRRGAGLRRGGPTQLPGNPSEAESAPHDSLSHFENAPHVCRESSFEVRREIR
jgi:hypothetical protein